VISAEILEAAKGKEIDLVLNMGEYQWTISGEEITGEKLQSVDMTVELDTKHIPQETVYAVAGKSPSQQLSLVHDGDFGFLAELTVSVGEDYAGQTGRLYYYNEKQALELIDSSVVGSLYSSSCSCRCCGRDCLFKEKLWEKMIEQGVK